MARVLTINAGSSSLRAALYDGVTGERRVDEAHVSGIGGRIIGSESVNEYAVERPTHATALQLVLAWALHHSERSPFDIVAHRIVHGGALIRPQRLSPDILQTLQQLAPIAPEHMPQTVAAIRAVAAAYPRVPQIGCFDTAFHASMPLVARLYPLPRRCAKQGIRRYGFHGLSCEYVLAALHELDPAAADGRIIVAHLGGGASMTAIRHGRSIDTTMGFSPSGGLMMSTRTGDLDPGVLLFLLRQEKRTPDDLEHLVSDESGLLGVSGSSSDMRDLLERETADVDAASAVALFCYLAKKSLGALVTALGGLDTLVFTGGIGENSPVVRARILEGLEALGIVVDAERNKRNDAVISADRGRSIIRVIPTQEDLMLARHARRFLDESGRQP